MPEADGSEQAKTKYVLEASEEIKSGIRMYIETTYKFFRIDGAGERELVWEKVANEKYDRHWVTPDGRVWIKTEFAPGIRSGQRLYVRDKDGDEEVSHGYGLLFVRTDYPIETYWDEAEVTQPKGDDSVELMRLGDSTGRVDVLCVLRGSSGTESLNWIEGNDDIDKQWKEAISSPKHNTFRRTMPINAYYSLWESTGDVEGHWIVRENVMGTLENRSSTILKVKPVLRQPDLIQLTHGSRLLWFDMTDAMLYIYDDDLNELHRSDLVRLGRYENVEEARASLDLSSLQTSSKSAWELLEGRHYSTRHIEYEQIETTDVSGNRLIWTIQISGNSTYFSDQRLSGLRARYKRELGYGLEPYSAERKAESPSGRFVLRIRQYERKWPDKPPFPVWAITLLSRETAEDGTVIPIELWSKPSFYEPVGPIVSDGGFSAWFKFYKTVNSETGEPMEMAACYVYRVSGMQLWGLSLRQIAGYKTAEKARAGTFTDKTTFTSEKVVGQNEVLGLSFPKFASEILTIRQSNGVVHTHHIINGEPAHRTIEGGNSP